MKLSNRGSTILAVVISVAAVLAVLVTVTVTGSKDPAKIVNGGDSTISIRPAAEGIPIPELGNATAWFNTEPLTNAALKGKVVLIDFWDASCINCRRTFPFLSQLSKTYASAGLVVVGVHSPEFDFEKADSYVERTSRELGVTWPVANDPEMAIWQEFQNQYWPAQYFVDRNGNFRANHIGEGDDESIENVVRTLLDEGGSAGNKRTTDGASPAPEQAGHSITPELYVGTQREANNPPVLTFKGSFTEKPEYRQFKDGASVGLRFTAKEVYAVLAGKGTLVATLDGQPIPKAQRGADVTEDSQGRTVVDVKDEDLYHLLTAGAVRSGVLKLSAGAGVQLFTYTFGS